MPAPKKIVRDLQAAKRRTARFAGASCALAALACSALTAAQAPRARNSPAAPSPSPPVRALTDELGRKLDAPAEIRRIVSLAPNLTETVFALGAGDRLVGDTDYCDYPPEANEKPRVGGPVNPSLEEIVSLTPDLVLATKAINRRETVEALARLGLPVYVTDPTSVDGMIASTERLGDVLHAEKTAAPLIASLRARLAELDRRLADAQPRRVLFVVWTEPLISVGRNTFIADALRRAGARSVVETSEDWPHVSLEEIVHVQPEFLIFADAHPDQMRQEIAKLREQPGWRDLDALRQDKIAIVSDAINRPAPRMLDAIEQMARALHPGAFPASGGAPAAARSAEEACVCAR